MSPGLPPATWLLSGSGRAALLTANLPQTEILTCQMCYLCKGRFYFLLDIPAGIAELWIPEPLSLFLVWLFGLLQTWTTLTWSFEPNTPLASFHDWPSLSETAVPCSGLHFSLHITSPSIASLLSSQYHMKVVRCLFLFCSCTIVTSCLIF